MKNDLQEKRQYLHNQEPTNSQAVFHRCKQRLIAKHQHTCKHNKTIVDNIIIASEKIVTYCI